MKKFIIGLSALVLSFGLVACGEKQEAVSSDTGAVTEQVVAGNTVGSKYLAAFANSQTTDVKKMVTELIDLGAFDTQLVEMDVEEGYLNGFQAEINGFSKGTMFSPMIGSIPFVGYVFESENPDELLKQLQDNADPRWNICTEADETVSYVRGNLVFFMMCTNE